MRLFFYIIPQPIKDNIDKNGISNEVVDFLKNRGAIDFTVSQSTVTEWVNSYFKDTDKKYFVLAQEDYEHFLEFCETKIINQYISYLKPASRDKLFFDLSKEDIREDISNVLIEDIKNKIYLNSFVDLSPDTLLTWSFTDEYRIFNMIYLYKILDWRKNFFIILEENC